MSLYAAGCLRAGQHLAQPPRTAAGHTHSQPCRLGIDVRLLHARSAAAGACRLGGAPGLSARCNRAALLLCPGNPVKSIACPTRFASFLAESRLSGRSEEHTSELQSL